MSDDATRSWAKRWLPSDEARDQIASRLLCRLVLTESERVTDATVVEAWDDFVEHPSETTWYLFAYAGARRLGEDGLRGILHGFDPFPSITVEQAFGMAAKRRPGHRCTTCFTHDGAVQCSVDCDHSDCHAGWYGIARPDGRVACGSTWLTPAEEFDHSWDAYSDL